MKNYIKKVKIHFNSKYHNILTKEFLHKEYTENKKSTIQIAKKVKCDDETIRNYLRKYNIKIRTYSEVTKGKNNPNFIDGRSFKQYNCSICKIKISKASGLYGSGMCTRCCNELLWQNPEYRANQIKKRKALWKNKEYRNKHIKAMKIGCEISPNKPEKILIKLLNKILPDEYRFVGSWDWFINGFCPDFVNRSNNKIIEMFGDYWHNRKDLKEIDKYRFIAYKKYGYKTLIIWEHELKNLDKVKSRILEFNKN